MQRLITAVQTLLASDLPNTPHEYITDGCHEDLPKVISDVVDAACEELIAPSGRPDHAAMLALRQAIPGVRVGPGEVDSFGWLSGVVYTPKGMVVYG